MTEHQRDSISGASAASQTTCTDAQPASSALKHLLPLHATPVRNRSKASGPCYHALKSLRSSCQVPVRRIRGCSFEPAGMRHWNIYPSLHTEHTSDAANRRLTKAPQALISPYCCRSHLCTFPYPRLQDLTRHFHMPSLRSVSIRHS